ncbi:hypothetical protein [Brevundimonas sp. TWP2-3-4b1]|uniref:hypothetical protein n=1 Tax=Brevundimonas sp. TWP2-3-4b1 TaxID=2804580 RepID=UPI003CF71D8A
MMIVAAGAWAYSSPAPTESADFAAWAQAIGSVAAIMAAIGLAVFERSRSVADRQEEAGNRLKRVARGSAFAFGSLASALLTADEREQRADWTPWTAKVLLSDVEGALESLTRLPIDEMPDPEASIAVLHAIGTGRAAAVMLGVIIEHFDPKAPATTKVFRKLLINITEAAQQHRLSMQAAGAID